VTWTKTTMTKKKTQTIKAWAVVNNQFEARVPYFATVYFEKSSAEGEVEETTKNDCLACGWKDKKQKSEVKVIPITITLPSR